MPPGRTSIHGEPQHEQAGHHQQHNKCHNHLSLLTVGIRRLQAQTERIGAQGVRRLYLPQTKQQAVSSCLARISQRLPHHRHRDAEAAISSLDHVSHTAAARKRHGVIAMDETLALGAWNS